MGAVKKVYYWHEKQFEEKQDLIVLYPVNDSKDKLSLHLPSIRSHPQKVSTISTDNR